MSAIDDLKERISSELKNLSEKAQESSLYIRLSEQYENLTPIKQKLTIAGASLFVLMIMVSIPWGYFSTSADHIVEFEDKRQLIRDLLKVSRDASQVPNAPIPPDVASFRSQIQGLLESDRLIPEQIKGIENFVSNSKLIPGKLSQGSVAVSLGQLNIRQVIDIGHQLQNISQSVKMTDLDITANAKDPHFFDVVYKLIILAVPQASDLGSDPVEAPTKTKKASPKGDE